MNTPQERLERTQEAMCVAREAMAGYRARAAAIALETARLRALRLAYTDKRHQPVTVNKPVGDNPRNGAVKKRFQHQTKVTNNKRTERSGERGQFID